MSASAPPRRKLNSMLPVEVSTSAAPTASSLLRRTEIVGLSPSAIPGYFHHSKSLVHSRNLQQSREAEDNQSESIDHHRPDSVLSGSAHFNLVDTEMRR